MASRLKIKRSYQLAQLDNLICEINELQGTNHEDEAANTIEHAAMGNTAELTRKIAFENCEVAIGKSGYWVSIEDLYLLSCHVENAIRFINKQYVTLPNIVPITPLHHSQYHLIGIHAAGLVKR